MLGERSLKSFQRRGSQGRRVAGPGAPDGFVYGHDMVVPVRHVMSTCEMAVAAACFVLGGISDGVSLETNLGGASCVVGPHGKDSLVLMRAYWPHRSSIPVSSSSEP
jgi:hypothetical protein